MDNLATGRREKIEHLLDHPWVTFIEGSITDLDLLMETFPGADGIFHGVAIPPVPRAIGRPSPPGRVMRRRWSRTMQRRCTERKPGACPPYSLSRARIPMKFR
nr:hypothetical protein [Methanoculleus sp. UBA413]